MGDPEMRELAEEEFARIKAELPEAEHRLSIRCCRATADARPCWKSAPERAATKLRLFAADLFRMYQRYAETQGWKVEVGLGQRR